MKTRNDEVVSFPLYVEAICFAFHEENMIRAAVRAVTLNVYHVGYHSVNRYITSAPHTDYFSNLVSFFKKQCMDLNKLISDTQKKPAQTTQKLSLLCCCSEQSNVAVYL